MTTTATSYDTAIGMTIFEQMGGLGRLRMMIGARRFTTHPDGASFRWPSKQPSRGNHLKVTLRGDDTYDMEFATVNVRGKKVRKTHSGIYCDQLKPLFEAQTGLYLSF